LLGERNKKPRVVAAGCIDNEQTMSYPTWQRCASTRKQPSLHAAC
jgi:hypothetical protein